VQGTRSARAQVGCFELWSYQVIHTSYSGEGVDESSTARYKTKQNVACHHGPETVVSTFEFNCSLYRTYP
jgi:hypothetical protein